MATIQQFKDVFFDSPKVKRAVDRAMRRTLSKFGAFVRQKARSSIRKRKAVSKPGQPPTNRTGLLRDLILFGYEPERKTVVIGPAKLTKPGRAPELLEYGGEVPGDGRTIFMTRDPGRDAKGKFVSNGRMRIKLDGTLRYKPRPFMRPARDAELPKFLESLKDSVRG